MTEHSGEAWFDEDAGLLVRPYTITSGRTVHALQDRAFSLITQVLTRDAGVDTSLLEPEPAAILEMCRDRPLGVAEIAATLDLPVSVVKVVLGDLLESSMILTRAPIAVAGASDVGLLRKVIDGINKL